MINIAESLKTARQVCLAMPSNIVMHGQGLKSNIDSQLPVQYDGVVRLSSRTPPSCWSDMVPGE